MKNHLFLISFSLALVFLWQPQVLLSGGNKQSPSSLCPIWFCRPLLYLLYSHLFTQLKGCSSSSSPGGHLTPLNSLEALLQAFMMSADLCERQDESCTFCPRCKHIRDFCFVRTTFSVLSSFPNIFVVKYFLLLLSTVPMFWWKNPL